MRPVTKITVAGLRLAVIVLAVYWCMIAIGTHLPATLDFSPRVNDKFKHCGAFLVLTLLLCYVTNADDWASDDAPDGSADGSADAGEKEAGEKEAGEKVAADEAAAAARREAKADQAGEFRRQAIRFGLIALVVVFYAAADEWTQRFVPRRTPDLLDFFADAGGMALGLAIYISAKLVFGKRIRNRFYPAD